MIEVVFNEKGTITQTEALWQYDIGQTLTISGIRGLDEMTEVHIENKLGDKAFVKKGSYQPDNNALTVSIPDQALEFADGTPLHIWIYTVLGDCGKTVREIEIPLNKRKKPENWVCQDNLKRIDAITSAVFAFLRENPLEINTDMLISAVNNYLDLHPVSHDSELIQTVHNIIEIIYSKEIVTYYNNDSLLRLTNGYYDNNGEIISHAKFMHTGLISVIPDTDLTYENLRTPSNTLPCIICFTDGVFSPALSYYPGTNDYVSGTFHIPENVNEIALETREDVLFPISVTMSVRKNKLEPLSDKIESLQTIADTLLTLKSRQFNTSDVSWENGYISKTGEVTAHTKYHTSELIPVEEGTVFTYQNLRAPAKSYPYLACYSENSRDTYAAAVSLIGTGSDYMSNSFVIPKGIKYISVSIFDLVSSLYPVLLETRETINRLDELEQTIENATLNPWKGKRWYAFGTSLTATDNTLGENGTPTGKYAPYLKQMSGMLLNNYGIAGGTIGSGGIHGGTSNILNKILSTDISNADLITIEGFVNDFACSVSIGQLGDSENTTVYGALTQAVSYCLQNSNATIVLVTESIGRSFQSADYRTTRKNALNLTQNDYNEVIRNVGKFLGVPVIDAGAVSHINEYHPEYLSDHIHHSELGGKQYASAIWNRLKSIHCNASVTVN